VTWGNTLQPDVHIKDIVAKATRVSFTIKRPIANLTLEIGQLLFKAMMHPILEYAAVSWSPWMVKDQQDLEKVQRWFTKMIASIKHLAYNERLWSLNLFSLRHRKVER
jgi:hypothetical protein